MLVRSRVARSRPTPLLVGGPAGLTVLTVVAGLAVLAVLLVLVGSGLIAVTRPGPDAPALRPNPLLADGAQLRAGGQTGPAVTTSPAFQAWLAHGVQPAADSPYAALATTALSDLYSLTLRNGGVIASTRASWHYVWPRDSAFAATAFAETGHLQDAVRALTFLQSVQATDGSFQARYRTDGSGPPDARGVQEDDPGWALWGVDEVLAAATPDQRPGIARELQPLVDRSLHRLLERTTGPGALPGPSSDYWELPEARLTLGVAAPTLAGLLAGSRLVQDRDPATAALATRRATTLRASIEQEFGSTGFSRYVGGQGPDAAMTFLLPPYLDAPLEGVPAAVRSAVPRLLQPGGGLSPGSTWPRHDQVSWTPETALFLLAAASTGDSQTANGWLTWFATRARAGRLPEKVTPGGSPGDVAPLAWTDALVLLALDRLDLIAPHS